MPRAIWRDKVSFWVYLNLFFTLSLEDDFQVKLGMIPDLAKYFFMSGAPKTLSCPKGAFGLYRFEVKTSLRYKIVFGALLAGRKEST